MQDMEMKKKVLGEIMGLMDQKDGERLKAHPAILARKISIEAPGLEGKGKEAVGEEIEPVSKEGPGEDESKESPDFEAGEGEMSEEMIQKLLEMLEEEKGV